MKNYKLPFTDRFGNPLHEGDSFKYTAHQDFSLPNFIGKIVFIKEKLAFGFDSKTPNTSVRNIPFANFNDLKNDFLRHIERITP